MWGGGGRGGMGRGTHIFVSLSESRIHDRMPSKNPKNLTQRGRGGGGGGGDSCTHLLPGCTEIVFSSIPVSG